MGISHGTASPKDTLSLTPLGEACSRLDLTAIHEILEDIGYKDDEGIANEVFPFHSFCFHTCFMVNAPEYYSVLITSVCSKMLLCESLEYAFLLLLTRGQGLVQLASQDPSDHPMCRLLLFCSRYVGRESMYVKIRKTYEDLNNGHIRISVLT